MDFIKKVFSATVGALAMTEEKIRETVDELVEKGEISETDGKGAISEILERIDENKKFIEDRIDEQLEKFLKKAKIATEQDLTALEERVEKLESMLASKKKESK